MSKKMGAEMESAGDLRAAPDEEMDKALNVWKTECAPLMIQQKGCISEKLLRCREAHELISYSEQYRNSDAHKKSVQHARALKGSKAEVKLYDLVT